MRVSDVHRILLVTQYDGGDFSGWQRQPDRRTVQGEMERVLERLCGAGTVATGAGRTDAGVHARGQGVGVQVPNKWTPQSLRRAMNALLPPDIWVAASSAMADEFHPRRSAVARSYRYLLGTDGGARSPFRRRYEWNYTRPIDGELLQTEAASLIGEHTFRAFAIAHTAPADDHHRCIIRRAIWKEREGGWEFEVEANRFLHHMVRFLVGTMIEVAAGARAPGTVAQLLGAGDNLATPAPAPAHGLSLLSVEYPALLYRTPEAS